VKCETVRRQLSARMDGAADRLVDGALDAHVAGCAGCRAFLAGAERVREVARLEPAGPVPDLVPRIMAEVRRVSTARRIPRWRPPAWSRYAAAFAAGALVAAIVAGGLPGVRRSPSPALAMEIPGEIARASAEVTSYRATFRILERGFHPRVPERHFVADVAFRAPEEFRARIRDLTAYPGGEWPRNDVTLAVDADRWILDAPRTCPRQALPSCAPGGRDVRAVRGRAPFDGDATLPTDVVMPVRTLAGSDRVRVVGESSVLGRRAVVVELAYRDATPLFGYLFEAGTWRPFFPHDRVLVSLDAESWFPLAYEVRAASSPERRLWAERNGLRPEAAGEILFRAEARSLDTAPSKLPAIPSVPRAADHGFRDRPVDELAAVIGRQPLAPTDLQGLQPYRTGSFVSGGHPPDEVLLSYARGLSWLVITETRSWDQPALFGDVSSLVQRVRLPGLGVAYYEPAIGALGRHLAIHAEGWDVALESNLPRPALLAVARSLPVHGLAAPERWLGQDTLAEARASAPYLLLPTPLPAGYRISTVFIEAPGVTMYLRRDGAELDGGWIRLYQAEGVALPPPLEPEPLAVRVRGTTGRYLPTSGELEWVEDGVYRSLGGTALDLRGLLSVAESLAPAR
jgi:putative zinc finger protein